MVVLLLAALLAAQSPQPDPALVRVRVSYTMNDHGRVDQPQKDRAASAADIAAALDRKKVAAVDTPESADITVEVTGRSMEPTGASYPARPFGPAPAPVLNRTVRATLRFGAFSTDMVCTTNGVLSSGHLWSKAAAVCARKIEAWTAENRERILAARK